MTDLKDAIDGLENPIINLDTASHAFAHLAEGSEADPGLHLLLHFVANTMGQIRDDLRARRNAVQEASKEKDGPALVG